MGVPRLTPNVRLVLRALAATPGREVYALEVVRGAGLVPGTVYPMLSRMMAAGWLAVRAEGADPAAVGRPERRYYRLTEAGAEVARVAAGRDAAREAWLGGSGVPAAAQRPAPGVAEASWRRSAARGTDLSPREKPDAAVGAAIRERGERPLALASGGCPPHPKRRVAKGFCSACGRSVLDEKVA